MSICIRLDVYNRIVCIDVPISLRFVDGKKMGNLEWNPTENLLTDLTQGDPHPISRPGQHIEITWNHIKPKSHRNRT